ncbi:DNA helicase restriction enzyme type iii r subunit [Plakobranchus ocellatus]|uniref:DNA helicase restriction enzyme type iii r subunit n=1 Tax=Plakobranchus ocellatus TaxID=259542 RepID=A0AAV4AN05_9GAST|nr:DNA helicase restriction enzyme type iii r subunit [Plakobranchus ocellatus]
MLRRQQSNSTLSLSLTTQKVSEEIQNMDDLGIWEATDKSSWVHHMVTIPKPNGDYRITTDLSPLNSRHLTSTLTHQGLRQYIPLPMGLKVSASVCQRLVSQTLANCPGTSAYLDDILIFGSSRAEHDANPRLTLQRLSDKDFRLQLVKCEFAVSKVTFLGHPKEQSYAVNEKEALACVWACETWEKYLLGRHFTLRTDDSSLASLLQSTTDSRKSAKFTRRLHRLSPFDYTVEYRQSKNNLVADALSRLSMQSAQSAFHDPIHDHVVGTLQTDHLSLLDVKSTTKGDSTLSTVLYFVSSGWPSKTTLAPGIQQFFAIRDKLQTEDQCLLRENRIVLPTALRRRLFVKAHEDHPGVVRMKRKLRQS